MPVLKAVGIAFSTYSVLPAPRFGWTEENMRFSLCALPLVGLPIGALLLLWNWLCGVSGSGPALFAAVAAVLPVVYTGGIHMDGFCDTADALSSHLSTERKLEILKDPHVGAFAVIYACSYMLLCFGLYSELLSSDCIGVVCIGFVLSRALAVLSALTLPGARKGGMLAAFKDHLERRTALITVICFLALCCAGMTAVRIYAGVFCILLSAVWFLLYRRLCLRLFGGATGDTTGFFIQTEELVILAGAALGALAERVM